MKYLTIILFSIYIHIILCVKLQEKFHWKEVSFAWPSELDKQDAIISGRYIPDNNLIFGLEVWKDKLFITIPRFKPGVAASLNYVNVSSEEISPALIPYPNWDANNMEAIVYDAQFSNGQFHDNSLIISAFRIQADECDRLWIIDSGLEESFGAHNIIAPRALIIFNLNKDTLIRQYLFSPNDLKFNSFLGSLIIDVPKHECENAFAYISDLGGYGVIVYSFKQNKSWRVKHNFFNSDPVSGNFNSAGVNFQLSSGILGMALGKLSNEGFRNVYFHAMASTSEFAVANFVLQNETRATSRESYYDYVWIGDRGWNGQSTTEALHEKTNIMFYTQLNKDGIGCWNANKPYNFYTQGLVDSDAETLVFPNDLKIDRNDQLWVLSNHLPAFLYHKLDPEHINYRILKGNISDLIIGTPCE